MNDHIVQTINDLEKKVKEYEDHALRVKTTINELCTMAGLAPRYQATDLKQSATGTFSIKSDQFHARPLATIVREYLEMRKQAGLDAPAMLDEIFDALKSGGYEFQTKTEQIARISLTNSLNKNPIFYRLPNKKWGLLEWYPKAKRRDGETEEEGARNEEKPFEPSPAPPRPAKLSPPPPRDIVREYTKNMGDAAKDKQ